MNKLFVVAGIAIALALVGVAGTVVQLPTQQASAESCHHDSTSSHQCFASKNQCIRHSPGKSGENQC
jgi:hypothetical protein